MFSFSDKEQPKLERLSPQPSTRPLTSLDVPADSISRYKLFNCWKNFDIGCFIFALPSLLFVHIYVKLFIEK